VSGTSAGRDPIDSNQTRVSADRKADIQDALRYNLPDLIINLVDLFLNSQQKKKRNRGGGGEEEEEEEEERKETGRKNPVNK